MRQVKAAVGAGGVCTIVEVAPWSRIPEARALLVPRDEEIRRSTLTSRSSSTGRRGRGTPPRVALLREEWRFLARWWTEEPVNRRYFEIVLESGENTVVFRHEECG